MPIAPRFNELKTTEAACLFIQLNGGKIEYLKLLKLLYLMDRTALDQLERPVTFDWYVSMKNGPVLSHTYDLIRSNCDSQYWSNFIEVAPRYSVVQSKSIKFRALSEAELDLINEIYSNYGRYDRWVLSKLTHTLPEYKPTDGPAKAILLSDILRALNYSSEDIERINSELLEEASIDAVFGD